MEENQYIEKERMTVGDIYNEAFKIFKDNFLTYLVAAITLGILMGAVGAFQYAFEQNMIVSLVTTVVNGLASAAITILYIVTSYNSRSHTPKEIGQSITAKAFPLFLTRLLLGICVAIPFVIIMLIFVFLLMAVGGSGTLVAVVIIPLAAYVGLKSIFISQGIVLDDKHYFSAIKWSFSTTKGELLRIIGISIVPILLVLVALPFVKMIATLDTMLILVLSILYGILVSILNVVVAIAMTVLYMDKTMEENHAQETITYGDV